VINEIGCASFGLCRKQTDFILFFFKSQLSITGRQIDLH